MVKVFGLQDIIPFGKFKGKTVEEACKIRGSWLLWADEEIEWFSASDEAKDYAAKCDEAQKIEQQYIRSFGRFGDENDWGGLTDADFS